MTISVWGYSTVYYVVSFNHSIKPTSKNGINDGLMLFYCLRRQSISKPILVSQQPRDLLVLRLARRLRRRPNNKTALAERLVMLGHLLVFAGSILITPRYIVTDQDELACIHPLSSHDQASLVHFQMTHDVASALRRWRCPRTRVLCHSRRHNHVRLSPLVPCSNCRDECTHITHQTICCVLGRHSQTSWHSSQASYWSISGSWPITRQRSISTCLLWIPDQACIVCKLYLNFWCLHDCTWQFYIFTPVSFHPGI